ncbi:transmembrane anti-sigma factor [Pandoraea terrae]|uniref:Transmembrane anti-sigma factor n=1 Tax=Pandoraea terrae TaxID=1537710 RepID=A0A5E4URW1_9BURK|nr:anti-sigma factor [Pandoraea terrae]VVE01635.1 transmembrane anti-sigma factor [Pandoraea terrae]
MNEQETSISEAEIHAYVDGTLSEARRLDVERALERNPELAARVSDYFSLNALLHERYDPVLSEPTPKRLQLPAGRRWRDAVNWPQFAGMAAALALGVGIGMGAQVGKNNVAQLASNANTHVISADGAEGFARRAAIAHVVYMPAVDRPVGIGADREQDFVQWLSNRLGTDVHPPILSNSGFELTGGRLLSGADGPMAMFMYRDGKGERVTLSISHRKVNANTTAFKLYQDGPVSVFYWVDGNFGYAVSGGIDRKVLLELSHNVYKQLTGRTPG